MTPAPVPNDPSLALVIPVRDDQSGLIRLLQQAEVMGIFDQVVISDDGSEPPVRAAESGIAPARSTLLRSDQSGGAGAARNRALAAVRTSHMIYFDSDDRLTPEFPRLWQELIGKQFDFCLFRHHDSRVGHQQGWGQMPLDNAMWRQAGAGFSTLFQPKPTALAALAETANYPWNKIYRTGFLRDHDLRCSETPVHNDIALHWMSFLQATQVLVSDRVAAVHEVHGLGHRLTNRSGAERLCVFDPLAQVARALERAERPRLRAGFFHFTAGLLDWIRTVLAPEHHKALDEQTHTFLCEHLDPDLFADLSHSDPVLALRLTLQMAGGRPLSC